MIVATRGDILATDCEAFVNTVNCVGVMGKGLAAQVKAAHPTVFKSYQTACRAGDVRPGRMHVAETGQTPTRLVINFPTKRHYRDASRLADIDSGLVALRATIVERKLGSIAVPPLGCGLGGLDWRVVRPMIEAALDGLEARVTLYEP